MRISANAIVTNGLGQVLLIRRDDTRMLAPPGGALQADELPTEAVVREVREETGLIVLPVRLVAVFFWAIEPDGFLSLVFRCLQRGGELQTSAESLQVGFFPTNPLPNDIFSIHRERVEHGLRHAGGPPYWGHHQVTRSVKVGRFLLSAVVYPFKDLRRHWRGAPSYEPPPTWQTSASVVIRSAAGEVVWVRTAEDGWRLPGGIGRQLEAPWETAIRQTRETTGLRVRLTDLTGVYVDKGKGRMHFTFTAEVENGVAADGTSFVDDTRFVAYFRPGHEPANRLPQAVEQVADADSKQEKTIFRFQEAAGMVP